MRTTLKTPLILGFKIHQVLFMLVVLASIIFNFVAMPSGQYIEKTLAKITVDALLASVIIFGWAFLYDLIFKKTKKEDKDKTD